MPAPLLQLAAVALSCTLAGAAVAQATDIPDAVVQTSQLSAAQRAQVQRFAQERLRLLDAGDPQSVQTARRELLEPLTRPNIRASVGFRLALSDAVGAQLVARVGHESDFVAANALLVAGAIASADALDALRAGLNDPRASVRFAAARGFETLVTVMASGDDALPGNQDVQALALLENALISEPDPVVVDALILAFTAAADGPDNELRFGALTRMCRGVAAQAQRRRRQGGADGVLFDRALVRAATAVRGPILRANQLDRDFAVQAAIMSGQALALALHRVEREGASLPDAQRDRLDAIARAVQTVLILTHMNVTTQSEREILPREGRLSQADLRRAVSHWAGPAGVLTRPPYNAAPAEFN